MKRSLLVLLIIACCVAGPAIAQDRPAPKEVKCRTAIEAGLEQLRRTPPGMKMGIGCCLMT